MNILHNAPGFLLAALLTGTAISAWAAEDAIPYSVAAWPGEWGNHRAVVRADDPASAVWAHIPWRRHDPSPWLKDVIVVDLATGQRIRNVVRLAVNREYGDIAFQPATVPGEYGVYYMPCTHTKPDYIHFAVYNPPSDTADPAWLQRNALDAANVGKETWRAFPQAAVVAFQARSEFDRFDPMELAATADEIKRLLDAHAESYLVFPEDRAYPVRMTNDLPSRWIASGPQPAFRGEADRGECYALQLGIYAARQAISTLTVTFSDLRSHDGATIPASAMRCINLGGRDCLGRPFTRTFSVRQGAVKPLWCLIDVPEFAKSGRYEGEILVSPEGAEPARIALALEVSNVVAVNHGDDDPANMSRLRWLNSNIGMNDEVVAPYAPLQLGDRAVSCLGRTVTVSEDGLLAQARAGAHDLLAEPMRFIIETDAGPVELTGPRVVTRRQGPGVATWGTTLTSGPFAVSVHAKMEFDGYIGYAITVRASETTSVKDIRIEIPYRGDAVPYMMGMGRKGGDRPSEWEWRWDSRHANNSVWLGGVSAGMRCKLKDAKDTWETYSLSNSPASWANEGQGGCTIADEDGVVLLKAFSGPRTIEPGMELPFRFGLLITPLKPLDNRHWSQRYIQPGVPSIASIDEVIAQGANIVNVHQGNALNPYINYPFLTVDKLKPYVDEAHAKGANVKIYYTVRELTNRAREIWALRSLDDEVYVHGGGGGYSWMQEHLVTGYVPAWHEPNLPNGEVDGSIATQGLSRWHNYYLEGMAWLMKNVGIDGLYLDGIGYDREIMKRLRKVMETARPGSLIDFHSGNNFSPEYGLSSPMNQYMEHLPYIDSLWFGELYDYDETPDYWLVEISGIPFGLYGEMLQGGGNPYRGMIYGMTSRLGWQGNPGPIWKLWNDFGIDKARMEGYWSPACPVTTDNENVLATAYVRPKQTLIVVASWAKDPVPIKLVIDWKALGLRPAHAKLIAPRMETLQDEAVFAPTDSISVSPGKGWFLLLSE